MSSTNYSYFNPNNYNSPIKISNLHAFDFSKLPLYSINGTQLLTYVLLGITVITLGYVTITEKEGSESEPEPEPVQEPVPEPEPELKEEKGGKKRKTISKKKKHKKSRKTSSRKNS